MAIRNSVGAGQSGTDTVSTELGRRYANVRAAMAEHELDGLVVAGSEYSGFEGAVTYLSGFQIVHRYAYVVAPADGDPFVVFPAEARYVGEHGTALIEQRFDPHPGAAIAAHARDAGWRRIGVYGLDYVMPVRDYRALEGFEVVPFDIEFDLARAVKSEVELDSVRDSVRINRRGFEIWADAYAPGRTAAEVMAVAEEYFVAEGCGRLTMNMVLTARGRSGAALPEFKIARKEEVLGDFVLPSLEVAGPGMHWVEVSRAVAAEGRRSRTTRRRWRRPTTSTSRRRRRRCGQAPRATTCTPRSRRGSRSAATTSATSRATRSG